MAYRVLVQIVRKNLSIMKRAASVIVGQTLSMKSLLINIGTHKERAPSAAVLSAFFAAPH